MQPLFLSYEFDVDATQTFNSKQFFGTIRAFYRVDPSTLMVTESRIFCLDIKGFKHSDPIILN